MSKLINSVKNNICPDCNTSDKLKYFSQNIFNTITDHFIVCKSCSGVFKYSKYNDKNYEIFNKIKRIKNSGELSNWIWEWKHKNNKKKKDIKNTNCVQYVNLSMIKTWHRISMGWNENQRAKFNWCLNHSKYKWSSRGRTIFFENIEDLVHFKLISM